MGLSRLLGAIVALALTLPAVAQAASTTTFNPTGAVQTYTVPAGTSYISATAIGARGGNNTLASIAVGATVTGSLAVSAGQVLYVYVGVHGIGGFNGSAGGYNGGGDASPYPMGGSGGGASDIRTTSGDLASRVLVAGGGGGPGNGFGHTAPGGNAGAAGSASGVGGAGAAGTQSAGGNGGSATSGVPGTAGSLGHGGTAGSYLAGPFANGAGGGGGGGGGGGYYGGGGGGPYSGGGGGSNYFAAATWDTSSALGGFGDGQVSITAVPVAVTVDPNPYAFLETSVNGMSSHTFTVTNVSATPTTLGPLGTDGPFGTDANGEDHCSGVRLDPGASCTVLVSFSPGVESTDLGPRSGNLLVHAGNDPTAIKAALSGTAVPAEPPAPPAITGAPQGTVSTDTASFAFSGEPGASFECSLDDGSFGPCTSPQSYTSLTDGQHTFRVRQSDAAGHVGTPATATFTVATAVRVTPTPDARALTLVVAKTGTVSRGRVPVGCRLDAGRLASCTVMAYAARIRVGAATAMFAGPSLGTVQVKLTARGRHLVHRLRGVNLSYRAMARTAAAKTLSARGASRVLPLNVASVPSDGLFATASARLSGYGERFANSLAGELTGSKAVRCSGYTDSVGAAAMNTRLGLARAKTLCARLRADGVHAKLTARSLGERQPRASNRTGAGRALNRRVELLVSYR
jgi:outer membrane protein OmpA-like peptidoglycan-associated protein